MPAPIIRNYLLRDTVDSTAEAIYLLNASGWASPADVPVYLPMHSLDWGFQWF